MLLIILATIYQGSIPNLLHTQTYAKTLSRMHIRYVLAGELGPKLAHFTHELSNTNPIREWNPQPLHDYPKRKIQIENTTPTRHTPLLPSHPTNTNNHTTFL